MQLPFEAETPLQFWNQIGSRWKPISDLLTEFEPGSSLMLFALASFLMNYHHFVFSINLFYPNLNSFMQSGRNVFPNVVRLNRHLSVTAIYQNSKLNGSGSPPVD